MPAGRRLAREEERFTRRRRSAGLDPEALEAAGQALIECWPWLAEQYRLGTVPELPMGPLEAAISMYLAHAGE